jgi:putative transcriptional regulator
MTPLLPRGATLAPRYHPAIESLADYAAGQLRAGFDVVVATHLRGCAQCRAEVAQLETIGGGLLETIAPAPLGDQALAAMMARLDEAEPVKVGPPARSLDLLLASARRRWIAPGTWIAMLDTPHDPDDRVFLLGVGAGRATAPHHHHGAEMTQVLTGALTDDGVIYRAGDLVERDEEGPVHYPQVAGDEACICLLATRGRTKAATLLGRIAFALAGV